MRTLFACISLAALLMLTTASAQTPASPVMPEPAAPSNSAPPADTDCNAMILEIIHHMPQGGGYSVKRPTIMALTSSIGIDASSQPEKLTLHPEIAEPSFCSEATYLVFVALVNELQAEQKLHLSPDELKAFLVKGQADGEGLWGRWNANGPGTARLFHELGLGPNFQALSQARPGDFLKIFWTDEIGAKEFGHSVIFLGLHTTDKGETMRIWSSNIKVGYSEKDVPLIKIKRLLFSRLSNPSALESLAQLPKKDPYLASMLTNSSSGEEMAKMVGL